MDNRKRTLKAALALVAIVAIVGAGLQPASAYQRPGKTELVSVSSNGAQQQCFDPGLFCNHHLETRGSVALSANGRYVAFSSPAENLLGLGQDTNATPDIFVHDRKRGRTERVSVASDGAEATVVGCTPVPVCLQEGSYNPSISSDGRYVAFHSGATNLVEDDTNRLRDVFIRDRKRGRTERVSVSSSGEEGNSHSGYFHVEAPSYMSPNGKYIAFQSDASNLDERPCQQCVYLHDRKRGTTEMVSFGDDEQPMSGWHPSVSSDGRFVSFDATAPFTSGGHQVVVRDMMEGTNERVDVASDGSPGKGVGLSAWAPLSQDGRYVVFVSSMSDLVPNDAGPNSHLFQEAYDVFVHDRRTERTVRVSVTSAGEELEEFRDGVRNGGTGGIPLGTESLPVAINANGRFVAFSYSYDHGHDGITTHAHTDILVHDQRSGQTLVATVEPDGEYPEPPASRPFAPCNTNHSNQPSLSADGRLVAFNSCYNTLVEADSNGIVDDVTGGLRDVFVRDMGWGVGVGGFGGSPAEGEPPDDRICIEDICIPPGASIAFDDSIDDVDAVVTERGANLIGGSIAHRAPVGDLYAVLELESMPRTPALAVVTAGTVYGLSFTLDGRPYEIRAASAGLGPQGETTAEFGLFDCSSGELLCTKVKNLKGGFGTTGERIVFSVPLDDRGIQAGSEISDVTAFTAIGTLGVGAGKMLDEATM